jgi:hypothetical protein
MKCSRHGNLLKGYCNALSTKRISVFQGEQQNKQQNKIGTTNLEVNFIWLKNECHSKIDF